MVRIIIFILTFLTLIMAPISADTHHMNNQLKAAFLRDGNLWILINGEEKQITESGQDYGPQWSYDGTRLLYQTQVPSENLNQDIQTEIWTYHLATEEKKKIFTNGTHPQWAPHQNTIAFKDFKTLDLLTAEGFYNISLGVGDYTWLPNGEGFLLSCAADLRPDGWTNPILYKKYLKEDLDKIQLTGDVHTLFTIPKEIGVGDRKIISIDAGQFQFSPSHKWISFIVSPTASWSMDSNMVCVLSANGKDFEVLDEVVFAVGSPKWAPTKDILAYIAGGGRIVFGFKDKDLKIKEFPVAASLTPEKFAELDFTWKDDYTLITSRVKESEWSNDFAKHPLPALYSIDLANNQQIKITEPPSGKGDYQPQYVKSMDKLIWFRSTSFGEKKDLWIANPNGTKPMEWLENVSSIVFYEE